MRAYRPEFLLHRISPVHPERGGIGQALGMATRKEPFLETSRVASLAPTSSVRSRRSVCAARPFTASILGAAPLLRGAVWEGSGEAAGR